MAIFKRKMQYMLFSHSYSGQCAIIFVLQCILCFKYRVPNVIVHVVERGKFAQTKKVKDNHLLQETLTEKLIC